MARESLGFVRMIWTCLNCGVRNPGSNRFCAGCGAPQPENVQFEKPSEIQYIQDQKEMAAAKLGADFHCGYCGARNPAGAKTCLSCNADLTGSKTRASGNVVGAVTTTPVEKVACPSCGTPNSPDAQRCIGCGAPLGVKAAAPVKATPFPMKYLLIGLGLIAAVIVVIIILSNSTKAITATVTGVNWQRSIVLEQFGEVTREDWKDNIPSAAVIRACEKKVSGQSNEPVDNGNKVCGTPYLVDKGNGYAESVQDCYYEVISDYCTYTIRDWGAVDTLTASGSDMNPYWPDVPVRDDLREGDRSESYSINFGWDSGSTNYSVSSESEFRQFSPGSTWNLDINTFGQIMSVNP